MDCNKDEAVRAKQMAEKKMQSGDFMTAQKLALKAKQLYPQLDNISQLLTVCEVHCSASKKVNGKELDLYEILQVERLSDWEVIKRQYRKLALSLHPDKNKFPGTEAAFKLIVDANRVLSDPVKRAVYDAKFRSSVKPVARRPPPHHQSSRSRRTVKSVFHPQYMNSQCQQSQLPTFWTSCSSCKMKYQYYSEFRNQTLRCPTCQDSFVAVDLSNQDVRPEVARNQFFSQLHCKVMPQSNDANPSGTVPQEFSELNGVPEESKAEKVVEIGVDSKHENKASADVKVEAGVASMPKAHPMKPKESRISRGATKKRERESLDESSKSFPAGSNDGSASENGDNQPRRSWRQKQDVSEKDDDNDDFLNLTSKRARANRFSNATVDMKTAVEGGGISKQDEMPSIVAADSMNGDANEFKQKENFHSDESMGSKVFEFPEAEFNNFDKEKAEDCFSVNQIWAIYDPIDGMPRIYAKIEKVYASRFEITWLEASPDDGNWRDWYEKELPIACGKFGIGNTQETDNLKMFSHQMISVQKTGKGTYMVQPKKGEIWAIFENWSSNWSSEPEKHRPPYQYEFVEILSDFFEDVGIGVAYLKKVEGFVSIFKRGVCNDVISFCVRPSEMYRFSHQVPAFKMTGIEAPGVPAGCFELDPASLPSDCFSGIGQKMKKENESAGCSKLSMPEKHEDSHEIGGPVLRDLNGTCEDDNRSDISLCRKQENGSKGVDALFQTNERTENQKKPNKTELPQCDLKPRRLTVDYLSNRRCEVSGTQYVRRNDNDNHEVNNKGGNFNQPSASLNRSEGISTTGLTKSPVSSVRRVIEVQSYDFRSVKTKEKFKPGQIWALYSTEDGLPRTYVKVQKIESSTTDFRVHVVMLESCLTTKYTKSPVYCGLFKVKSSKTKVLSPAKFSHQLKAEQVHQNTYAIYPRKGEIWAVYKNWNPNSESSYSAGSECDIVEVLEETDQGVTVVTMIQFKGSDTFYRAPLSRRQKLGWMHIQRADFSRLSHQCAAFKHTGERESRLKGFWELEPASIPGQVRVVVLD